MWEKRCPPGSECAKAMCFQSQSGSSRVMGDGATPVPRIYGVTVRKKREKKSLAFFFLVAKPLKAMNV